MRKYIRTYTLYIHNYNIDIIMRYYTKCHTLIHIIMHITTPYYNTNS